MSFEATQKVDVAVVEPIARTYEEVLPKEVRSGLRNFFRNLASPVIFINFMLQMKPAKAFETLAGRFALNSTVGIGGLMDVAKKKPFYLPYARTASPTRSATTASSRGRTSTCR